MNLFLGILLGIGIAAALAFLLQRKRLSQQSALETRLAAAESLTTALRQQIGELTVELGHTRKGLSEEQEKRVSAETKLGETSKNLEAQWKLLEGAQKTLTDTFRALSGQALQSNNEAFLQLAKQSLETVLADARGDLGQRQEAIKGLVHPLEETLKQYQQKVSQLEQNRAQAYGELKQQIDSLAQTERNLQKEAENLVSALRLPQVRGRWGEMTLKRVVELSGMSEHCDFREQPSVQSEEGRLKPDLVIHLPARRQVVVDAKTPLNAYLDAIEAPNDEQRDSALTAHAAQLRTHMTKLSSKAYWNQFPQAPEFVIMFIPGESFFGSALRFDKTLIEDGIDDRVVIATPTTLIALLRAIAYGWRQEQLTKNAQEIADIGRQIYSRFQTFLLYVSDLRKDLEQSVFSFNKMIGSLEGRILPGLKKFRELGATGEPDLPVMKQVEQAPRQVPLQETAELVESAGREEKS